MGILGTIRDALALPAMASGVDASRAPLESPWASPNHLVTIDRPDIPGTLTRATAMAVPAVARARRLIVGTIARCPLEARQQGERMEDQPRWITRTDGNQSPWYRMIWTVDDLLFYGWSLWGLERDRDGRVIRAERIPFDWWAVDGDGDITIKNRKANPEEVCLIPGPDEGLLNFAATPIYHAYRLQTLANRAAETPNAQLLIKQTQGAPMSAEAQRELINSWVAARRGQNGGIAFTNQAVEVEELGAANEHLMIEGRNIAAVDIARAVGIPALMIDAGVAGTGTVTYKNAQARNLELVDYSLAPMMAAVAARLGMDDMVPRGTAVAFDLTDLTGITVGEVDVPDDDTEDKGKDLTNEPVQG